MELAQQFYEAFGRPVKRVGDDLFFKCPDCGHKSLSCSLSKGCYHCFHCHFKGWLEGVETQASYQPEPVDQDLQQQVVQHLLNTLDLSKHDRRELVGRGIRNPERYGLRSTDLRPQRFLTHFTPEQLVASGLFTQLDWGISPGGALQHGNILIPYWQGSDFKGLKSRVSSLYDPEDGKRKYLHARGFSSSNLWFFGPPRPGQDLIVTEGEFKAMVCLDNGFWACSLPGVANCRAVAPQVSGLARYANRVFIILDSDVGYKDNAQLQNQSRILAQACGTHKSVAFFLPPNTPEEKMGVDDFLLQFGPEELEWWMEWAWIRRRRDGRPVLCGGSQQAN